MAYHLSYRLYMTVANMMFSPLAFRIRLFWSNCGAFLDSHFKNVGCGPELVQFQIVLFVQYLFAKASKLLKSRKLIILPIILKYKTKTWLLKGRIHNSTRIYTPAITMVLTVIMCRWGLIFSVTGIWAWLDPSAWRKPLGCQLGRPLSSTMPEGSDTVP